MMDTKPDSALLRLVSRLVFRLPGRAAAKMAEFSHTEYGSGLDMLQATQLTTVKQRRKLYYRHALDELEHARLFRERVGRLPGTNARAHAILADHARVHEQGIHTKEPLFQQLDEPSFLAFVWVHERNGEHQFRTYADVWKDDADTSAMFQRIFQDERFHVSYSENELKRLDAQQPGLKRRVVLAIRLKRLKEAWLRLGHVMGHAMASLWLGLAYVLLVGPFSLVARLAERSTGGFVDVTAEPGAATAGAAEQG
jgi:hypothetical protein